LFFVRQFDKAFTSLDSWQGSRVTNNIRNAEGDSLTLGAAVYVKKGDLLQMKIGLSYTTVENARNNLKQECPAWDFVKVRNDAQDMWNEWLGKIDVKGGTVEHRIKFYTDLWHVLLGRHKTNDISGDYPDRTTGVRKG